MSWDRSHEFICSEGLVTRNIGLKKYVVISLRLMVTVQRNVEL